MAAVHPASIPARGMLPAAAVLAGCWLAWGLGHPMPSWGAGAAILLLLIIPGLWTTSHAIWSTRRADPRFWALAALAIMALGWLLHGHGDYPPYMLALGGTTLIAAVLIADRGGDVHTVLPAVALSAALLLLLALLLLPTLGERPLGVVLALGAEPPFGNPNFALHALLPLSLLGLGSNKRLGWLAAALGCVAALGLGLGLLHPQGDAVRAAWLALAAGLGSWTLLRRWPRLAPWCCGAGLGLALLLQALVIARLIDPPAWPSAWNRIGMWRASLQALAEGPRSALLLGFGPGACPDLLPAQSSFALGWLAVPGWAADAHHAPLSALLAGGLLGATALSGMLVATLLPLWQRRREALPAALLAAWAASVPGLLLEGHLSKPGPLAALALLLGLSWWTTRSGTSPAKLHPRILGGLGLALTLALLLISGLGRGEIEIGTVLADRTLAEDPGQRADQLAQQRARWGDLDELLLREAWARAQAGQLERAQALAMMQRQRLSAHPGLVDLAERLAQTWIARNDQQRAADAADLAWHSAAALQAARRDHPCLAPEFLIATDPPPSTTDRPSEGMSP